MTTPHDPSANTPDEDALFAFVDDPTAAPANDLEATVRRLQRATGQDPALSSSIPTDLKHRIWEDLMHTQTATMRSNSSTVTSNQGVEPPLTVIPSLRGIFRSPQPHQSRLTRAVMRWQPAVSLAVVVAFLVGLIGIAYQQGVLEEPDPSPVPDASGQSIPEDYNPRETPVVSDDCVPHSPRRLSNADLEAMALEDWQDPIYVPAGPVPAEIGEAALDTYLGWFMCQRQFYYDGSTPDVYASENMLSYYSDRWQYITLAPSFANPREDEIARYWKDNEAHIDDIITGFPLPLNRTSHYILEGTSVHYPAFQPGDLFRLPDDRYGVVFGMLTTEFLQTGQPTEFEDGHVWFVGFEEYDGLLYVDEMFPFCANGQPPVLEDDPTATPTADGSRIVEDTERLCL